MTNSANFKMEFKRILSGALAAAFLLLPAAAIAETVRVDDSDVGKDLKLPVIQWQDSSKDTKAIIFAIHGATLYAKTFDSIAKHLGSEGYPVFGLDMRGFGRWRAENDKYGGDSHIHYTQTKEDIEEVLGLLRRTYPHQKIYLLGESVGANMAIWLLSTKSGLADGAILCSPCIKRITHVSPNMLVDVFKGLTDPYKDYNLEDHIRPYLSENPKITDDYLADPMIKKSLSVADLLKSTRTNNDALLDVDKIASDAPLLVVAGEKDKIYSASAIPDFMRKVGSQRQTIFIEPNKGHLILEASVQDERAIKVIDDWLNDTTGQKPEISRQPDDASPISRQD